MNADDDETPGAEPPAMDPGGGADGGPGIVAPAAVEL